MIEQGVRILVKSQQMQRVTVRFKGKQQGLCSHRCSYAEDGKHACALFMRERMVIKRDHVRCIQCIVSTGEMAASTKDISVCFDYMSKVEADIMVCDRGAIFCSNQCPALDMKSVRMIGDNANCAHFGPLNTYFNSVLGHFMLRNVLCMKSVVQNASVEGFAQVEAVHE